MRFLKPEHYVFGLLFYNLTHFSINYIIKLDI